MNEKELYSELKKIGIPVAYREFKRTVKAPYIVYFTETEEARGDDLTDNLISEKNMVIELYTTKKDVALEGKIKNILRNTPYYFNEFSENEFFVAVFEFDNILKI